MSVPKLQLLSYAEPHIRTAYRSQLTGSPGVLGVSSRMEGRTGYRVGGGTTGLLLFQVINCSTAHRPNISGASLSLRANCLISVSLEGMFSSVIRYCACSSMASPGFRSSFRCTNSKRLVFCPEATALEPVHVFRT